MKIMVLNLGSTSFKFKLFEMDGGETLLAHGGVECIGDVTSPWELRLPVREEGQAPCPRHEDAFDLMMGKLVEQKVLKDFNELDAIGYKGMLSVEYEADQHLTRTLKGDWVAAAEESYRALETIL